MTSFKTLYSFVVASILISPSYSALYKDPSQLPSTTYDYVVIGAGIGGSIVAARLSENPNHQILLIEAGGSDADVIPVSVPLLGQTLRPFTPFDWNYTTTP
ncbi:hypothetical protein AX16_000836 [Volvariella volvacea WC 439]|nr:hypothetical protein AX16_000836 [Volvariella volvacea WC 439]